MDPNNPNNQDNQQGNDNQGQGLMENEANNSGQYPPIDFNTNSENLDNQGGQNSYPII